jgi:hemerythrin superfamily protein
MKRQQPSEELNEGQDAEGMSAVEMLREDHRRVQELFEEFEGADTRSLQRIADQALTELEVHAKLEETVIYPAIREVVDEEDLMDEALEEHHAAELLIKELRKMGPKDVRYRAKFKVLAEMVKHHIEEEESQVLPQAEESDLDLAELGQEAMDRKEKLMAKIGSGSSSKKKSTKSASGGRSRKKRKAA